MQLSRTVLDFRWRNSEVLYPHVHYVDANGHDGVKEEVDPGPPSCQEAKSHRYDTEEASETR